MMMTTSKREKRKSRVPKTKMLRKKKGAKEERKDICVEGRSRQGNKGEEKQNNIDHPRPKHVLMSMCVVTGSGQNKQEKPKRKSSSEHQIKRRGLSLSFILSQFCVVAFCLSLFSSPAL